MNIPPVGEVFKCLWGNGVIQLIKYGNGTTERRKMICNKLKAEECITTNQYGGFDKQDQQQLINGYGMNNYLV
jgi:hypothetical protein